MSDEQTQFISSVQEQIEQALGLYAQGSSIEIRNKIPVTSEIPSTHKPTRWYQVNDVICVFVDMKNSTILSASKHARSTASVYKLFTETAVRILDLFGPAYIDVRGDGVFALFDHDQPYTAIAAAVSFKTFATKHFREKVKDLKLDIEIDAHIGIDQGTILVRKLGMSPVKGRDDRQNEVWAGKPVNMASKLASIGDLGDLLVSDRYFNNIQHELVTHSCDCSIEQGEERGKLWSEYSVADDPKFNFDMAYRLGSQWCSIHGQEWCERIMSLDD